MLHRFRLRDLTASVWKNGGGVTREIACVPAHSNLGDFDWRVSVATIEADGPFSTFDDIDRTIMLLTGPGVRLSAPTFEHRLSERLRPFEFRGEEAVECEVLGGPSTDFNLMARRSRGSGQLSVHSEPIRVQATGGVVLAVGGRVELTHDPAGHLDDGCGVWWDSPSDEQFCPEPGVSVVVAQWQPGE